MDNVLLCWQKKGSSVTTQPFFPPRCLLLVKGYEKEWQAFELQQKSFCPLADSVDTILRTQRSTTGWIF